MEKRGPVSSRPAKTAFLDLALLCLAGIALRLLLSFSVRLHASNPSALPALVASALGAAAAALAILWVFLRVWRRRKDWTFYLAAAFLFVLLYKIGNNRPPSILWASLLVISWSAGLAISARRYE